MADILLPIIIALITSVIGPVLLEWTKSKFKKNKTTDPLPESIKYNEQIEHQLDIILDELGCDQIFIAQFHNGGHFYPTGKSIQKFSVFYEKMNPNVQAIQHVFQQIPVSLFPKALSKLYKDGELGIVNYETDENYDLMMFQKQFGCKSFYMLAIDDLDDHFIGVLGLAFTEKEHKLSKEEWIFIRQKVGAIGSLLTDYLYKKK